MTEQQQVIEILADVLQLKDQVVLNMGEDFALLGAIPEFDSMAVISVLTALEDQYNFFVDDDEIDAEIFTSVSSLVNFVEQKLSNL